MRLQPVIEEALKLLRGTLPSTIEINTAVSSDCGPIVADPTEIHQVVMNLCTNAYHAMRQQGGVLEVILETVLVREDEREVVALEPGKYARLMVTDSGHGIDAETLGRIFEPYFRTKDQGEGTGLGLATTHAIVESCGGKIDVESEPGRGATFRIFLPVCTLGAGRDEEEARDEVALRGSGSVLVVDDEKPIITIQETMLKLLGYKVTSFTSSTEALMAFRESPNEFDVIITDQTMPKMPGVELAKEMLKIRQDLPVILCTGHSDTVKESDAKAAGCRGYLKKPFDTETLASAVRDVLNERTHKEE